MKLSIDNLDGQGPRDYTSAIDVAHAPRVLRSLNKPAELRLSLLADSPDFIVPVNGARVILGRTNGSDVFTGYLASAPDFEYLGWGERGPVYRYNLVALGDELLLDRKTIPDLPPFVARSAGDALRQLTEELLPGAFDSSAVQTLDEIPKYSPDPQKRWSEIAAEIGMLARAAYRIVGGKLILEAIGSTVHHFLESQDKFSPDKLKLQATDRQVNDLIVVGGIEPQAHVKDYFVGDGLSLRFYLSQQPFTRSSRILLDEEYQNSILDRTRWEVSDPASAITLSGGKLQVDGGTGAYGQTVVRFIEKIELSGALVLQHGDVILSLASDAIIGGLYPNEISTAGCLAGFHIGNTGGTSNIQALINGSLTGPVVATEGSHHYVLTTRLYASQVYRQRQMFHSSAHPAGSGLGGDEVPADLRVVLEVHDIDPANPGTIAARATVLYDAVIAGVPSFCTYALVNAANLHCSLAFSRMTRAVDAEVRSALPGQSYRTRLTGALSEGAECRVSTEPALQFFPEYVPAANEQIVVRYRGRGRAMTRVVDSSQIARLRRGLDDGVRGCVRQVKSPATSTSFDCEIAALALLEDMAGLGWTGEYQTWGDFLPASDIFPGNGIRIEAPSRSVFLNAVIREVLIEIADLRGEHCRYILRFADDASEPLAFDFEAVRVADPMNAVATAIADVGTSYLPDLVPAEVTQVSSTTVSIDAGIPPPQGGGIEVRFSDSGWGLENDRNLLGRFTSQNFSLPRWGRTQTYFLRQHDASSPPKYSRYSAALHIDYPL